VTVFSPNDISGLRRPKNIKCGTKVASSMRMMEKVFIVAQLTFLAFFAKHQYFSKTLAWWRQVYAKIAYTFHHHASGFYIHYTSNSAER